MRYTTLRRIIDKQEPDQFGHRMALTQRLQMRQSQALVMTPQLMQAIKLLQLSNLDLAAYVEGELERNPLLDAPSAESRAAGAEPDAHASGARRCSQRRSADRSDRREPGDQPQRDRDGSAPISKTYFPTTRDAGRAARPTARRAIRNGPASAPAAARTATTIWRPSFRPRPRSPTIWPSSLRWRSPIRSGA